MDPTYLFVSAIIRTLAAIVISVLYAHTPKEIVLVEGVGVVGVFFSVVFALVGWFDWSGPAAREGWPLARQINYVLSAIARES